MSWKPQEKHLTGLGVQKFDLMSIFFNSDSRPELHRALLTPLENALAEARSTRSCPSLPDLHWLELGIRRVLMNERSGREFLQRIVDDGDRPISTSLFFESLKSARRLRLCGEINDRLVCRVRQEMASHLDPFATEASLDGYAIFAGDGHYLAHACHDRSILGHNHAVGHFMGLDLRTHAMFRLTTSLHENSRKREHDMHALKRLEPKALRRNTPVGKRVIWVWDRAGIDAKFWSRCKQQHGVYFVSRTKDNMDVTSYGELSYDQNAPANNGVTGYHVAIINGERLRRVSYVCPDTGVAYDFLTSLTQLEPGIIAALYLARWDIEKVFDETKRKLGEGKSWATSETAKAIQAEMIAMTHNLLLLLERQLEEDHAITNQPEDRRRSKRIKKAIVQARERSRSFAPLVLELMARKTQRVLKFVRWTRNNLLSSDPLGHLLARLRAVLRVS